MGQRIFRNILNQLYKIFVTRCRFNIGTESAPKYRVHPCDVGPQLVDGLTGLAKALALKITANALLAEDGYERVIEILKQEYAVPSPELKYLRWKEYVNFQRTSEMSVSEYLLREQTLYHGLVGAGVTPFEDEQRGYHLLEKCNLTPSQERDIVVRCISVSAGEVRESLRLMFPHRTHNTNMAAFSGDDFRGEISGSALLSMQNGDENTGSALFSTGKGGQKKGKHGKNDGNFKGGKGDSEQQNVSRKGCFQCGCMYHWKRDCPYKKGKTEGGKGAALGSVYGKGAALGLVSGVENDDEFDISFLGMVTDAEVESPAIRVGRENAILDTGATDNVVSEGWIREYQEVCGRDDFHRAPSKKKFVFGDGKCVKSLGATWIPMKIDNVEGTILCEVIPGNLPLLLGRPFFECHKAKIDFGESVLHMCVSSSCVSFPIKKSVSGHMVLQIWPGGDPEKGQEQISESACMATKVSSQVIFDHRLNGHFPSAPWCAVCNIANGVQRKHFRIPPEKIAENSLSVDIAGPFPPTPSTSRYFLVAAYRPKAPAISVRPKLFPFVRLLKTKSGPEVLSATKQILIQIRQEFPGYAVNRLHSDMGPEFTNQEFRNFLTDMLIRQTTTEGNNPRSNGAAEASVGIVKRIARALLVDSKISAQFWGSAVVHAAYLYRNQLREEQLPPSVLRFGCPIIVTKAKARGFEPRGRRALYLGHAFGICADGAMVYFPEDRRIDVALAYREIIGGNWGSQLIGENDPFSGENNEESCDPDIITQPIHSNSNTHNSQASVSPSLGVNMGDMRNIHLPSPIVGNSQFFDSQASDLFSPALQSGQSVQEHYPTDFLSPTNSPTISGDISMQVPNTLSPATEEIELNDCDDNMSIDGVDVFETVYTVAGEADGSSVDFADADKKEFEGLVARNTFIEVSLADVPSNAVLIPTRVVRVRKSDGTPKSRIVAQGTKLKDPRSVDTESPTCTKEGMRALLTMASTVGNSISRFDIKQAFLQGSTFDDEEVVFLKPPKDKYNRKIWNDSVIWKLNRPLYGLRYAPRRFFLEFYRYLQEIGLKPSKYDRALYIHKTNNKIHGFLSIHVDDGIWCGDAAFVVCVQKILQRFDFSSSETLKNDGDSMKYLGVNIVCQSIAGRKAFSIEQNDYYQKLNEIDLVKNFGVLNDNKRKLELNAALRRQYQQILGCLMWLVTATRPALAFAVAVASQVSHSPTVAAAEKLNKVVRTARATANYYMVYPSVGSYLGNLAIYVFGDAAFANNDDCGTQGGCAIFVGQRVPVSEWDGREIPASLLYWQSRKLKRVVNSTLSAETIQAIESFDRGFGVLHLLREMTGVVNLSFFLITDCKSLVDHLNSFNHKVAVGRKRLTIDIKLLVEAKDSGIITQVIHVPTTAMYADELTKNIRNNGTSLLETAAKTGKIKLLATQ